MNTRLCLNIAGLIDAALLRELGEGIDLARMLAEPVYARDVLLVCEGFIDGELVTLAQEFRAASAAASEATESTAATASEPGPDSSGFSPSRFLNSILGAMGGPETPPPAAAKARQRGFGRWGSGRR